MRTWTRRRLLGSAVSAASAAGIATATAVPAKATPRTGDIADALRALPGLRVVEERPGEEPGYRFFVLALRQPVDHMDPAAGTFEQRLTLLHTSADRPTVLFTTGYEAVLTQRRTEPAILLGGNQVQVEHRYFGASRPPTPGYTHLTIRQAADDHHRVVRLLRRLYPGAWISTGGSKGGLASVYHRRFHPYDVDGTVAYSAPNNVDDRDDSAYLRFLDTVGTAAERNALKAAQRQILLRRTEMVARYEAWAASAGDSFRIVGGADKALEIAVLRVLFMYWQNSTAADRPAIPGPDAGTDALYTWLESTAGLPLYADEIARHYIPYWYQVGTQLGRIEVLRPIQVALGVVGVEGLATPLGDPRPEGGVRAVGDLPRRGLLPVGQLLGGLHEGVEVPRAPLGLLPRQRGTGLLKLAHVVVQDLRAELAHQEVELPVPAPGV
jgi:hypothetical protein